MRCIELKVNTVGIFMQAIAHMGRNLVLLSEFRFRRRIGVDIPADAYRTGSEDARDNANGCPIRDG